MFAYKLFSSVGLKWCPKANREQVGFWGMNPPNSFTVKINQFKLFRSSQQHINIYAAKLTLPRTLHMDFLHCSEIQGGIFNSCPCCTIKSRAPLWLTAGIVPSSPGRAWWLAITSMLLQPSLKLCLGTGSSPEACEPAFCWVCQTRYKEVLTMRVALAQVAQRGSGCPSSGNT